MEGGEGEGEGEEEEGDVTVEEWILVRWILGDVNG